MSIQWFVKLWNKHYGYTIVPIDHQVSKIECKSAALHQEFLNEDLIWLLKDLPELIKAEQQHQAKQDSVIRFRLSSLEKAKLQQKLKTSWFKTVSAYIRDKILS